MMAFKVLQPSRRACFSLLGSMLQACSGRKSQQRQYRTYIQIMSASLLACTNTGSAPTHKKACAMRSITS